ncbi:hypothetical protein [Mycobacterium sp.]|uniref:hypothetical protein n=1 Tax=Mycobacterium sp. TaxID=1785 RepID=UPI003BAE652C
MSNGSDAPIWDVMVCVGYEPMGGADDDAERERLAIELLSIPPREWEVWMIGSRPLQMAPVTDTPEIRFTDATNAHWVRTESGMLETRQVSAFDETGVHSRNMHLYERPRRPRIDQ